MSKVYQFQSTLPVRGATRTLKLGMWLIPRFQSTLPVRGATKGKPPFEGSIFISIHAPREGSDTLKVLIAFGLVNFNPRSP